MAFIESLPPQTQSNANMVNRTKKIQRLISNCSSVSAIITMRKILFKKGNCVYQWRFTFEKKFSRCNIYLLQFHIDFFCQLLV